MVRPNGRFVRIAELLDSARTVWRVWYAFDPAGLPTHVKLVQEQPPHRIVTVSLATLLDQRFYRPLSPGPEDGLDALVAAVAQPADEAPPPGAAEPSAALTAATPPPDDASAEGAARDEWGQYPAPGRAPERVADGLVGTD